MSKNSKPALVDNHAMKKYIYETQEYALHILENRKQITEVFVNKLLEKKYQRILLVASGTSYNSCLTSRNFFEHVLKLPVELSTAHNYANYSSLFKNDDLVITVSQQGESTNTLAAIEKANRNNVDNFIVTEDKENSCTKAAQNKVTIECGFELFGPKTKGYTCTVLTLHLMALEAASALKTITVQEYKKHIQALEATLSNLNHIIEQSEEFLKLNHDRLMACQQCMVLGYGPHVGTALEGALKSLETVRNFYFSFETEEFLHGPLAAIKPDVFTFVISNPGKDYQRSHEIFREMSKQNENVYSIGKQTDLDSKQILDADFVNDEYMSVFEYIIPLQLLAYRTYTGQGKDLNVREYPRFADIVSTKTK